MNAENTSAEEVGSRPRRRSRAAIIVEFLGSMNLAITLLSVVAVASVIGTVLQQNQDYAGYQIKFGPFWFEFFETLGLYDVYSAWWFLAILAFLVISTSVCVYRHLPVVWREVTRYRDHVQATSLRVLSNHRSWRLDHSPDDVEARVADLLRRGGYRVRRRERGDTRVLAAMKGRANRLGYLFTHLAVVVIAVGGLIDGNVAFKLREYFGDLEIETRNLALSQVPTDSRLPVGTGSFRGSVTIPEGQQAGVVFLSLRDGYVVQDLPFSVKVADFRIRHYASGQPKAFESELVIFDDERAEPLRRTISVNDPLTYKGYSIYQASFQDGGSRLDLRLWPLGGGSGGGKALEAKVFEEVTVTVGDTERTIEFTDFDVFNVRPDVRDGADTRDVKVGNRSFRNVGPSFKYKLRRPSGEAREFHNYMAPVTIDGAAYFLSGVRNATGDSFRYLHVPVDPDGTAERFIGFLDRLRDDSAVSEAAEAASRQLLQDIGLERATALAPRVASTADRMIERLRQGGFPAVESYLQSQFPQGEASSPQRRETLISFSRMVLERTLFRLYRDTLAAQQEGGVQAVSLDATDQRFFRDALDAVSGLSRYGAPFWLQLKGFDQVQASGLQITRSPGKNVVYTGFALLTAGVFLLFYVAHRRVWALVIPHEGFTELLVAGVSKRNPGSFSEEFAGLGDALDQELHADNERG